MSLPRIILAIFILIAVYGGGNYYVARRLYQWLGFLFPNINIKVYICIYVFFVLSFILAFLQLPFGISRVLHYISSYWIGVLMYLFLLFFAADIVILLGRAVQLINASVLTSIRFYSGLAVVLLTIGFVCYGIYNANQIKTVNYEIELKDKSLNDFKIVMISDLHLGDINSEKNLEKVVLAINNLNPDIVCISGDIFNDDFGTIRNPARANALLKSLNTVYGVYACLGNHDGGRTLNQMIAFLEESDIKLLNDEYVIIDDRLALFGRLDAHPIGGFGELKRQDISQTLIALSEDFPVVVMEHNPSKINEYGKEVALILSGHTHSGQMFPGNLMTDAMFTAAYGHYQKETSSPHVIVTSGVNTWRPPMRIGTNNEVVNIIIR